MADADILAKLRLNAEEFDQERRRVFGALETDAEQSGGRMGSGLKRGLIAGGVFVVANELRQVLEQVAGAAVDNARELDQASRAAGVTVERYQALISAGREIGVNSENMGQSLSTLADRLSAVQSGADDDATAAFNRMGVAQDVLTGRLTSTDQALEAIIESSAAYSDEGQRTRDIIALLGEEIDDRLLVALANGDAALLDSRDRFEVLGSTIQTEHIEQILAAEQTWNDFATATQNRLTIWAAYVIDRFADVGGAWSYLSYQLGQRPDLPTSNWSTMIDAISMSVGDEGAANRTASRYVEYQEDQHLREEAERLRREGRLGTSRNTSARRSGGSQRSGVDREAQAAERYNETLAEIIEQLELEGQLIEMRGEKLGEEADMMEAIAALHGRLPDLIGEATAEQEAQVAIAERMTRELIAQRRAAAEADAIADKEADAADALADKLEDAEENAQRQREGNIRDLADLYENTFAGGTGSIWDSFEEQGRRAIAELLAMWSAGFLFPDAGKTASSGLSSLFGPLGSLLSPQAAFGGTSETAKSTPGGWFGAASPVADDGTIIVQGARVGRPSAVPSGGSVPFDLLAGAGIGTFSGQIPELFGINGNSFGGAIGGAGGGYLASQFLSNALGPAAGPIGAAIGGAVLSTVFGAFKSTKRGSAILTGVDNPLGYYGNSQSRMDEASGLAGSVSANLRRISEVLDAQLGAFNVSIGIRGDSVNVDPQGRGYTKTSKFGDIRAFGGNTQGAVDFATLDALQDMVRNGTLTGISGAAQRILVSGQNIDAAIEKALLIESVPKMLRERLDPLGEALDAIDEKFDRLRATLNEAGGTAEQYADAEKLRELERKDAFEQFGAVSDQLKGYLLDLQGGSHSPLSLREQLGLAQAELDPYLAQIRAGEKAGALADFDQAGYRAAADEVLGLQRAIEGSTGGFFDIFYEIRDFTETAIGLIDSSVPTLDTRSDPFTEETAKRIGVSNDILIDNRDILKDIREGIASLQSIGSGGNFVNGGGGFGGRNSNVARQ